ncbi:hypothetical protein FRB96_002416 [Tulasnella sp. 330]|nr:hypothetical protein FRB96_002416 [Tulasnella sp. 330]KAG8885584.1 hypothetical protein FRB97_000492 [Tulasnella sp. 331]KAG8889918.1 hypothetical protein FRB98_001964 [Tulasnella sp. 332]
MSTSQSEGRRQQALDKQRQAMMEDFDKQKQSMIKETEKSRPSTNRFTGQVDSMEESLKRSTVGLVHLEDFMQKRKALEEAKAREAAMTDDLKDDKVKKKKRKAAKSTLSFAMDDEEAEEEGSKSKSKKGKTQDSNGDDSDEVPSAKRAKLTKNPFVDTSFLPDREREENDRKMREELRKKWLAEQEEVKKEEIEVTYSYWDGSGHRKSVMCKKGDDISTFLEKCRQQFPELRGISVDNLMYIKEDLIIPHHYTFYDFIINKARGKSGPLFNFDVHDDVRMLADATVEKDESHAGKVVERSWYQRSKHIFPANRWEVFDPEKQYGKYTIA